MTTAPYILLNELDKEKWNDFLSRQAYSHFWHTWEWGEFLARFNQREILRFSFHEKGGSVLGVSTVCIQPLPRFGKLGDSIPFSHFSGPILQDGLDLETRKICYMQLINATDRELSQRVLRIVYRIWDPF